MKPSKKTCLLFQELPDGRHDFTEKLGIWNVPYDELEMDAMDFPYFRDALINKAIKEGDIQQE